MANPLPLEGDKTPVQDRCISSFDAKNRQKCHDQSVTVTSKALHINDNDTAVTLGVS